MAESSDKLSKHGKSRWKGICAWSKKASRERPLCWHFYSRMLGMYTNIHFSLLLVYEIMLSRCSNAEYLHQGSAEPSYFMEPGQGSRRRQQQKVLSLWRKGPQTDLNLLKDGLLCKQANPDWSVEVEELRKASISITHWVAMVPVKWTPTYVGLFKGKRKWPKCQTLCLTRRANAHQALVSLFLG